jgi:hypothetical protein
MPLDKGRPCPMGKVTCLNTEAGGTAAGATTVLMLSGTEILLLATETNVAPSKATFHADGLPLHIGQGWRNETLAEWFPGVTSPVYLWALSPGADGSIRYSHA